MLPKKKRVTKALFQTIMKEGRMLSGPFFVFRYLYPQVRIGGKDVHLAIVAPKSIAKKAILRNKLRRKAYNIVHNIDISSGSGIFFYKKPATLASTDELRGEMISLLKKAKLL